MAEPERVNRPGDHPSLDEQMVEQIDELQARVTEYRTFVDQLRDMVAQLDGGRPRGEADSPQSTGDLREQIAAKILAADNSQRADDQVADAEQCADAALSVVAPLLAAKDAEIERWKRAWQGADREWAKDRALGQWLVAEARSRVAELTRERDEVRELLRGPAKLYDGYPEVPTANAVRYVLDQLDAAREQWGECHARHVAAESGRPVAQEATAAHSEPQWQITIRVPMRLPVEARHELFEAVTAAVSEWEPPNRSGWDTDVSGHPAEVAQEAAPESAYLSSGCQCGHVLNWHTMAAGCTVRGCSCSVFSAAVAQEAKEWTLEELSLTADERERLLREAYDADVIAQEAGEPARGQASDFFADVDAEPASDLEETLRSAVAEAVDRYDPPVARVWQKGDPPGDDRELFVEAIRYVLRTRHAAQTGLQRNLRVGFVKAGRLLGLMESWGLVGPAKGSHARDVLVKETELDAILAEVFEGGDSQGEIAKDGGSDG